MTQDEYNQLVAQHGGIASQLATGPNSTPDPDFPASEIMANPIPDDQRQQKIVFKDGYYITVQPQQDGTVGIVQPLAKSAAAASTTGTEPVTRTDGAGNLFAWDPKTNTWSQVSGSEAKLSAEEQQANAAKAAEDQREREYNSTHPDENGKAYYLTHAELAALQEKQKQDSLSDKQASAQIANMEADNKRLDAQLAVSQANADTGKISAQASQTSAAAAKENADTNSKATDAQIIAEQAARDLAAKKQALDEKVANHEISASDAAEAYKEEHDKVVDLANNARLLLDQQTEADRVAAANRTADQTDTSNTETARHNKATEDYQQSDVAERAREADQTAEQNRQQEAERIGEAGAQALANALPFMAPSGTSADLAGIRNGMLSNPAHPQAAPPARSVPFPYDPATIVQKLTAQALANLSPTAKAVADKAGSAPPAPVAPVAPAYAASTQDLVNNSKPLLGPGMAGTADDTGLGPTPPGAFPITPGSAGAPGAPIAVNLHFYAPTGGPTPGQRGSLDSGSGIDPITGQPTNPFAQGVTV